MTKSLFPKETPFNNGQWEDFKAALKRLKAEKEKAQELVYKPIPGYETLYGVSEGGLILSYGDKSNHLEPIILKPSEDKDGCLKVTLQKNKVRSYFRVSRLVATVYLPNPLNLPFVNHIDEDVKNNNVSNLEWTDEYRNWIHSDPSGEIGVI